MITVGFVSATSVGRSTTSGIYRFIRNRTDRLREATGYENAAHVSRAHLPRLLNQPDWAAPNSLIEQHFGIRIERDNNKERAALDGKTLRGTVKSGDKQSVILGVTHGDRKVIAYGCRRGNKSSEIPAARDLLKQTGLERRKVSSDAHHCNPPTTAQIDRNGGLYLIFRLKGISRFLRSSAVLRRVQEM